jgi:hypothetical protein
MNPFWKTYQKKLAGGLAQATLWLCTSIFLMGSGLVPSSKLQIKILLLGIGCVLLLLAVVGAIGFLIHWFSSRKKVVKPKALVSPVPTPQQIRQQRINEQMEFLSQFPKPSERAFEALKFLAMNPRDGALDIQGVASLYYDGDLEVAKSCLQELIGLDYIERAGPAMHSEWNNHYRINERGITCVNIYAV